MSIPCSVSILTRNSGSTLRRALESVKDFSDVVVCDGGSTDDTLAIAEEFGARSIAQKAACLEENGRIRDYACVRNQTLSEAKEEWFLFLDSDEYLSEELRAEIQRTVASNDTAAYWVPRKYVHEGRVIERSLSYPNKQMRFFKRSAVKGFRKPVHEKVEIVPGTSVRETSAAILVPTSDISLMRTKQKRYIAIELARQAPIRLSTWLRIFNAACKVTLLYMLRLPRFLAASGTRLPLSYEFSALRYQWLLVGGALSALFGRV